jgi:hypothetical protein
MYDQLYIAPVFVVGNLLPSSCIVNSTTDMYKHSLATIFSRPFRGYRFPAQPHQTIPLDLCSGAQDPPLVSMNEAQWYSSVLIIVFSIPSMTLLIK